MQDALADANTSPKPVEIRVAQGTYKPDEGAGVTDGDRTATFRLMNGVTLKGGYAGDGEPDPNARDVSLYETTLSGDLNGNDVPVSDPYDFLDEPTRGENSYHVVSGAGIDETSVLDGFIVTAGNANHGDRCGGGMYSDDGYPTILNCTFSDNLAYRGGGMYTDNDIGPRVSNCIFSGNYAVHGAVYGKNMSLISCTFTENMGGQIGPAGGLGGGVSIWDGNATLIDCVFTRNWAGMGGGMAVRGNSEPRLINCTFIANSADFQGGAICPMLYAGYGMTVMDCTFIGNSTYMDGGAYSTSHDSTKFFNCTFSGNHTNGDGGAYCVSIAGGDMAFNNCIFWGNTASGEGPQIAIKTADANVSVSYCDVQGGELDIYVSAGTLNYDSNSNIEVDPCFVDADGVDDTAGTE
ncbi:MAG: right-handed parallel beta-helix repeat-containing protein, partial [Planctomycetota bacterium]